ncbi:GMC family oxidoreductase [Temperatibacter marinus]|uniref:GMC family oxidoreductase n=1 Tax=Temperatibacter marinus TaxID=1456591 RepID=A0AA52HAN9_9PROT|nr:GMC family oxidoreductase [Temperatibacter marinus]WND02945.1 GMC family oxidoreductase [Temperatibacter marinus]
MTTEFDAIVVGSGISGGWAAKELTEKGLKVLLLDRGRHVKHSEDYPTEGKAPWEMPMRGRLSKETLDKDYEIQKQTWLSEENKHFWVKDSEHPYVQDNDKRFNWHRGYHLGGRSLIWGKQCYRLSDLDFEANKNDGHGSDWPIRYKDLSPWYDHVERFAGISGSMEGLSHLPDGVFQPPMDLNCAEKFVKANLEEAYPDRKLIIGRAAHLTEPTEEQMELGRGQCQSRNQCGRGCSFGAYFSSQSATLPAAQRTNNLTIVTDAIGHSVIYDPKTKKASGVRVIDANTKQGREYRGKLVFLCASAIGSTQIMLNSVSETFQNGIANGSGVLGHYLMDHVFRAGAGGRVPGFLEKYYVGRRPNGTYIPRFRNLGSDDQSDKFLRGYGYQGGAGRGGWSRANDSTEVGVDLKNKLQQPGDWWYGMTGFGEMLPRYENHMRIDRKNLDQWGMPMVHISCEFSENERNMLVDMRDAGIEMLKAAGLKEVHGWIADDVVPGQCIHEMGTARMGHDPKDSILNGFNQAHEVSNLFVTDGASMASAACQNPSLTYMALTARAADYAVTQLKAGKI